MAEMEHKINARAQRAGLRRLSERANAFPDRIPHPPALVSASNSTSTSTSTSSSSTASTSVPDSVLSLPQFAAQLADHLSSCSVPLSRALSHMEFERIEAIHGFVFPPDLRALLSHSLPTAPGFPDWRSPSSSSLTHWLNIPVSTISSLVQDNGFWCSKYWGSRPTGGVPPDAARHKLRMAPVLIPVFGFFFLPASPNRAGNPIFLVRDGALVCCGGGLWEFLRRGFSSGICDGLQFDRGQDPEENENRRWSTSTVIERTGSGDFRQDQVVVDAKARTRSLPCPRRDSVIIEEEDEPSDFESWGRNLDALARCSAVALKRRRRRKGSIAERRRSSFSGMEMIQEQWSAFPSDLITSVLNSLVRFSWNPRMNPTKSPGDKPRRIEFWSDAAERLLKDHRHRETITSADDDPFRFSMCLSHAPVSHRRTGSSTEVVVSPVKNPSSDPSQDSPWISSLLEQVATQLRSAGWREEEISEMVEGASPKSVLVPSSEESSDVLQVIRSRMTNVPYFFGLSLSLKKAGFSSQEVSDVLCFDPMTSRSSSKTVC